MSRSFFGGGSNYPPGCSGPPDDGPYCCVVCGGDPERDHTEVGGCVCPVLYETGPGPDPELGDLKSIPASALEQLHARFSFAASQLLAERKRRFALNPTLCYGCKQPMTFEQHEQEQCNYHADCRVGEEFE